MVELVDKHQVNEAVVAVVVLVRQDKMVEHQEVMEELVHL